MSPEKDHALREGRDNPYRGEPLNGAAAPVCPGFAPDLIRYLHINRDCNIYLYLDLLSLFFASCFAAGYALRIPGGLWPGFLAFLFYAAGVVLALLGLIVGLMIVALLGNGPQVFQKRS